LIPAVGLCHCMVISRRCGPRARCSTLFPYTTLFRSERSADTADEVDDMAVILHLLIEVHLYIVAVAGEVVAGKVHQHHVFGVLLDRKSTRLNSSHVSISYAVFCLKRKKPVALRTWFT